MLRAMIQPFAQLFHTLILDLGREPKLFVGAPVELTEQPLVGGIGHLYVAVLPARHHDEH